MTIFNNRRLDEYEERMHAEGRCICCGVKVKRIGASFPFECLACAKIRKGIDETNYNYGMFAGKIQFQKEAAKRLGYATARGDFMPDFEEEEI